MSTYISMLRGINVSGQKKIKMVDLKKMYESLGFKRVVTYVQSGNVVFDSNEKDRTKIASLIEKQIVKSFGYSVPVFIRQPEDLSKIIKNTPFSDGLKYDTGKLCVIFLYRA
ncbi:DUF1697 domain-containing protein [Calditrichota bacterium]